MASIPSPSLAEKAKKPPLQLSGMLSRDQLTHLFRRFELLTSQPAVKKRVADAAGDRQEAVALTTAIKEEILLEMGIDPNFGIACLGKVNAVYEQDMELIIQFYKFLMRGEMICDEAELGPEEFAEKMHAKEKLQDRQLEMLKSMRKYRSDEQLAIFKVLQQQMENANFDSSTSVLTLEQIENVVQSKSGR